MDRRPAEPDPRRKVPTLLWFMLAVVGIALFAGVVILLGGPSPIGVSDNVDPAVVESQSPVAPGIKSD